MPGSTHLDREHSYGTHVNVRSYGAVGNGVDDDWDAIQSALLATSDFPTIIFFPPGRYLISKPLDLTAALLKGAGGLRDATVIVYKGSTPDAITLSGVNNRFEGFSVIADNVTNVLALRDCIRSHISDISINSASTASAGILLTSDNINFGTAWNSIDKFSILTGTPLSLNNGTGFVNLNRLQNGLCRSNVANNGIVLFINNANNNVFENVDVSYYGGGVGIAVDLQGTSQDNTFLETYIDTNAALTGYFFAAACTKNHVIGGANGAGAPFGGPSIALNECSGHIGVTGLAPGTPTFARQDGRLYQGSGVPNNANGSNGDIYFRTDTPGTANQRMYIKSAGVWIALVL